MMTQDIQKFVGKTSNKAQTTCCADVRMGSHIALAYNTQATAKPPRLVSRDIPAIGLACGPLSQTEDTQSS